MQFDGDLDGLMAAQTDVVRAVVSVMLRSTAHSSLFRAAWTVESLTADGGAAFIAWCEGILRAANPAPHHA